MALAMAGLWARQRATGDASLVDVGWACGVGGMAVLAAAVGEGHPGRRALVGLLGAAWAGRLALHLLRDRVLQATEEDGRYQRLRTYWGERAQPWFFVFFQAQAFFVALFALPFFGAAANASAFPSPWDAVALVVFVVSLAGEAVADRQLARFRKDPSRRGEVCRAGLWRYSRHPNYFFEWLHWWSYVALAAGSAGIWLALAGPVVMLLFLFRVTGIPHTEARALESRGEAYRRYQRETSVFVPWFPRKEAS
jgi:steroid 5-alpha reductase family enzyme